MDQTRFDAMTRILTSLPTRRHVLRGLAGAGLGLGSLRLTDVVTAKNKRRKKKKGKKRKRKNQIPPVVTPQEVPPLVFNQYGCIDVGQPCRGDSTNCCSGICQGAAPVNGQTDQSRCAAHGTGGCTAEFDGCQTLVIGCGTRGFCFRTTGKASFCGGPGGDCIDCARDADCEAGYGPGAACVVCDDCNGNGSSGTVCYPAAA